MNKSLDEKIQILEAYPYLEELKGNTMFNGYPIGQWAISIRSAINNGKLKLTPEQRKRLDRLGILERKIDSTIDEKINALVEWRKQYPKAKFGIDSRDILNTYATTEKDQQAILQEYEKMLSYYKYVIERKSKGKLTEMQIKKCKEGNVGGIFGYPTKIERIAEKYKIDVNDMDYLITKYGTFDNFYEMFIKEKIEEPKDIKLGEKTIRYVWDIDGTFHKGYDALWRKIIYNRHRDMNVYSSKKLQEVMEDLTEEEKFILDRRFGLTSENTGENYAKIGEEMNKSRETVRKIASRALGKLRYFTRVQKCCFCLFDQFNLTEDEREMIEKIEKEIHLQNGDLSENLKKLKELRREKELQKQEHIMELDIVKLGISSQAYNVLSIAGIHTVQDLANITEEELRKIKNKKKSYDEIIDIMKKYGIPFQKTDKPEKVKGFMELGISKRTATILTNGGIKTLEDLANMTLEEFMNINRVGEKNRDEIIGIMMEHGISFQKTDKPEEIKPEDMTPEQLLQKILEQQAIIDKQQRQIDRLKNLKIK